MQIDQGIAFPERLRLGRKERYPWMSMKVGESFLAPLSEKKPVQQGAYNASRRKGRKYVTRTIPGEGVRAWRVE